MVSDKWRGRWAMLAGFAVTAVPFGMFEALLAPHWRWVTRPVGVFIGVSVGKWFRDLALRRRQRDVAAPPGG